MILTVEKIKMRFNIMLTTSEALISLGIYLSNIFRYFSKLISNINQNQANLQNLVKGRCKNFSNINKISPVFKYISIHYSKESLEVKKIIV